MATNYDDISDDKTIQLASSLGHQPQENIFERLFEEKCLISVPQDEIMYVQENVERFVSEVVKKVIQNKPYQNFIQASNRNCKLDLNDTFNANQLLTVGSFYEQTKNNYPDEFDFIFVLAEGQFKDNKHIQEITSDLSDLFHEQLKGLLSGTSFQYGGPFESCCYAGLHGPASKIKLVFNDESNLRDDRTIYVDISVASRLQLGISLPKELQVCYDEWKTLLLETGSCLVLKVYKNDHPKHETGVNFTITETEQYFMKHRLSEKHRQVYRLLKYIFNGNEAKDDRLKKIIRKPENQPMICTKVWFGQIVSPRIVFDLPSYAIKTLMFHHVHRCHHENGAIEECLKSVLNNLLKLFKNSENSIKTSQQANMSFDVSLTTMLGQTLEVADDYYTAMEIRTELSKLLKLIENHQRETEKSHSKFYELIPFTEQNISTLSRFMAVQSKNRFAHKLLIAMFSFYIICVFVLAIFVIVKISCTSMACDTKNPTQGNASNNAQYCCTGTKDAAIIWRNVTCSRNNIFLRFSVNATEYNSTELIQDFLLMNSAGALVSFETGSDDSACFVDGLGKEITETAEENSTLTCCRDTAVGSNGTNEECIDSDTIVGQTLMGVLFVVLWIVVAGTMVFFSWRFRQICVFGRHFIKKIETTDEEASVQQTSL